MDLNFDDYKRIDAYFKGELSKAEEQQLLEEIAASKELQEEFEFEKFLRGKTNAIPEEDIPHITPVKKIKPLRYLIAAGIAGILIITLLVIYKATNNNNNVVITEIKPAGDSSAQQHVVDSLAATINTDSVYKSNYAYFQPTGNEPPQLGNVMLAYQQRDYSKVFGYLDDMGAVRGEEKNDTDLKNYSLFYKALSFAETGETDKSVEAFQQLINAPGNDALKAAAQWYLALQLIKQKNVDEASAILSDLSTGNNAYTNKAAELLKLLQ